MIFKYTPEEQRQLDEIDKYYEDQEDRINAATIADSKATKEDYTDQYMDQRVELILECLEKQCLLHEQFEQERFNKLGGDPDVILENAKEQIDLIIKHQYDYNNHNSFKVIENGEIIIDRDSKIEKKAASSLIDKELRLHFDFLKKNFPKQYNALRNYKYRYLQKSSCIIHDEQSRKRYVSQKRQAAEDDPLTKEYYPMLNNTAINGFSAVSLKKQADPLSKSVIYTTKQGDRFAIRNIDKLQGNLATSARKILYTAISYLTRDNYSKGGITKATVEIPLYSYAEANGKKIATQKMDTLEKQQAEDKRAGKAKEKFVADVRRDLDDLQEVKFSWDKMKGKAKGQFVDGQIISSGGVINHNGETVIRVNFDVDAAQALFNAGIMQFPKVLLKHDNRNSNGFSIGYAIATHNSNLQNIAAGTADTLRVKSLLADAPDIPTIDELKAKGRRDWKKQIKEKLENALDSNIDIGYLKQWQYRDSRDGSVYTPKEADALTWEEFYNLCIDYSVLKDNPQLEEYVQRKEKEKAAAKEKEDKQKGKKIRV